MWLPGKDVNCLYLGVFASPLISFVGSFFLSIEEINSTQNKDARIQSLQPFVKNGYIKFSKKHKTLLKQMTEYPMGKNDDAPDGLQMAVKLALDVKTGRRVDYRSVIARALDFRRGAY